MMNKYQKALYIYSHLESETTVGEYTPIEYEKARKKLNELVEIATPQKLDMMRIKKYDGYNLGICQCGEAIDEYMIDSGVKYCPKCGQAIDWSDEE